jgi:predicted anti-sigma-YlaC factor YlaD
VIAEPVRCRELVEVVTDWLEQALPEARLEEVEEHLAICPDCVRYVDQVRVTTQLLRDVDRSGETQDGSHERLLRAFRSWTAGGRRT